MQVVLAVFVTIFLLTPALARSHHHHKHHRHHKHHKTVHHIHNAQYPHLGIETPVGPEEWAGRASWYSQFHGSYAWVDRGDRPGSNPLGVPDHMQGIALRSRRTLGKWFYVKLPDGRVYHLQQTDIGPAPWTGKAIDISARAAEAMGFSPKSFPSGSVFTWSPAPAPTGTPPNFRNSAGHI